MRGGELARAGGVNAETLRYYERRGLLAQPPRLTSGYRGYPPEALNRIRLIKQAQAVRGSLERLLCECCHSQRAARECPSLNKHASA